MLNGRCGVALATILMVSVPCGVRAQVHGVVVSAADGQPIPYSTVIVGDEGPGRFASAAGQFTLGAAGKYRVRARQIGFVPLDTTVGEGQVVLRLQPIAAGVATTAVQRQHGCDVPGLDATTAVFGLLRDNAERYRILLDQYPFNYRVEESRAVRLTPLGDAVHAMGDKDQDSVIAIDTASYDSRQRHQYGVGSVLYEERQSTGEKRTKMYLPTLSDLADPAFETAHCFAYAGDADHELRIDFLPADQIKTPDIAGSVYLDDANYVVRRAVFRLTHGGSVLGRGSLTVTTTFREVKPSVPTLESSRTEQPLASVRSTGGLQQAGSKTGTQQADFGGGYTGFSMVTERRLSVQLSRVLDRTFFADTIGGAPGEGLSRQQAGPSVVIALSCAMPPSFESADASIYATLSGAGATDARAGDVLAKIRPLFHMPDGFTLAVYGLAVGTKVTQTLAAQVAFMTDATGHTSNVAITATSLLPAIDSALVDAIRHANLRPLKAGHYTLSLSGVTPPPDAPAVVFSRLSVSVIPIVRAAALDPDSTQPRVAVNGTFEFVVDEQGRAMPSTLLTAGASPDAFAIAAKALPSFRFRPAVAGSCPIKQEVLLSGLSR